MATSSTNVEFSTSAGSTLILGGGIIGLSAAYYLSLHQPVLAKDGKIHIIDSAPSLFLSASGHAGGFLAKDWFSSASAALGALSFRLHREMAEAHDGARNWGYAKSTAYSLAIDKTGVYDVSRTKKAKGKDWLLADSSRALAAHSSGNTADPKNTEKEESDKMLNEDGSPAWITKQKGGTLETISNDGCCAQIEPRELSRWLLQEVEKRGVKVHLDSKVTGVVQDDAGEITGVHVQSEQIQTTMNCRNIVIACGAWSTKTFKTLFPDSETQIGIRPLAGYSITLRSPRYSKPILDPLKDQKDGGTGMCHAVFCAPSPTWTFAPEAISRMPKSGRPEVYVAGLNDPNMPLPPDVTGMMEMYDSEKARKMKKTAVLLTGLSREGDDLVEDDLEVVREAICARPVTNSGQPIIAKLEPRQLGPGLKMSGDGGVFIASGHGPWGISLSLGTGLIVSELLQGKRPSADIGALGVK